MERRDFFRTLAGAGAITRPRGKNRRAHHQNTVLFHGPFIVDERVLEIAARAPIYRTTHRDLAIRLQLDGVTYLFRSGLAGDSYVGEVVRTPEGKYRVHCWTVANSDGRAMRQASDIINANLALQSPANPVEPEKGSEG